MKFIRNSRIRDRIVDIAAKTALFALSVLACLWMISGAKAADITGIHQGATDSGEYAIDFAFSSPLAKDDVAVEFQRNFIQVSLKGVTAYPARTEKLTHPLTEKIFTYQYQPDLARARVLLRGQASAIEKSTSWEITPRGLRLVINGGAAVAKAALAKPKESKDSVKTKAAAITKVEANEDPEDAQVVQQIVDSSKKGSAISLAAKNVKPTSAAEVKKTELAPLPSTEEQPIFASQTAVAGGKEAKAKTSPLARMIASLLLVVGIIGAGGIAYRRFVLGRGMPFQRHQNRMIETVATQNIGPKRAVTILRVLDQYLVVGMAGDNMNLLANLGTKIDTDKYTDEFNLPISGGTGASFADAFQGALGPKGEAGSSSSGLSAGQRSAAGSDLEPSAKADFRSMIKKRIEGFKPL